MSVTAVILAAGEGTRMKSKKPKVLHEILGKPMIQYVVSAVRPLNPERIVVVVGHGADRVTRELDGDLRIAVQEEQLGTGHAVMQALPEIEGVEGDVLVLCGDTPLVSEDTVRSLIETRRETGAAVCLLTAELQNPFGYGRVIREGGVVTRIVEENDATDAEREVKEINAGSYCFKKDALLSVLDKLTVHNAQAEYYLTDAVAILTDRGEKIVAHLAEEPLEGLGVNSRAQLAEAARILRRRVNAGHMAAGVTIVEPELAFISPDARIGRDTIIHPSVIIEGKTTIGEDCVIGPNVRIAGSTFGDGVVVEQAVVKHAVVEDCAMLGPFCYVRPGTKVGRGAKIGGFVEVKKSEIGDDAKVPHLSYVGDAKIGRGANLGAGTITCNFDGFEKHETIVEEDAFVGSDTMLVAPVRIGRGAVTGAGSAITRDVPPDALGIERSEQRNLEDWAKKKREQKGRKGEEE